MDYLIFLKDLTLKIKDFLYLFYELITIHCKKKTCITDCFFFN